VLATLRHGLDAPLTAGADALPAEVAEGAAAGLVRDLSPGELRRALRAVTELLPVELGQCRSCARRSPRSAAAALGRQLTGLRGPR
jgi:hypothetical protein